MHYLPCHTMVEIMIIIQVVVLIKLLQSTYKEFGIYYHKKAECLRSEVIQDIAQTMKKKNLNYIRQSLPGFL